MSKKSIRRSSRAIYTRSHQTLRRSPRLLSSGRMGKVSSLQSIDYKDSAETHLGNLSNMSMESGIKSRLRVDSHQISLRRSTRFPPTEKLKPVQKSTFCRKSVEIPPGFPSITSNLKKEAPSRKIMEAICGKGPQKQSRSKSGVILEEKPRSPRRSLRLASRTEMKVLEIPQGFPDGNPRRQSMRLFGVAPVSAENEKVRIEDGNKAGDMVERKKHISVECKPMISLIRRSSPRLMSTLSGVMKTGVTLEVTDKGDEVTERLNADRGNLVVESKIDFVITKTDDLYKGKRRKMEEDNDVENRSEKIENEECCGTVEWTNEQEEALQKAYLIAKPSPHFWKKVSRMVPGKSAQECFDKVHASIVTPLSHQPQSRTRKKCPSPIANLNFSANIFPHVSEIEAGRLKRCRTKKLAAQKTVRHLLRKQCLIDQTKEGDHFSLFESSPVKIAVNVLNTTSNSPCLSQQPGEKLSAKSKMFSRFKPLTSPDGSSPQVLKRIKNRALHDRYIDQLHHREARRVTLAKKSKFDDLGKVKCFSKPEHGALKAARIALISDAKSFINHFQHTLDNPIDELDTDYSDDADEDNDASYLDE